MEERKMMYGKNEAMAGRNRVNGFNPMQCLQRTVSEKTGREEWRLDLRFKKLWFRLKHPQGRIRVKTLQVTEQEAIVEARVYLNRLDAEPASSYTAQCEKGQGDSDDYIRNAQNLAQDHALSDAGFGLQSAPGEDTQPALGEDTQPAPKEDGHPSQREQAQPVVQQVQPNSQEEKQPEAGMEDKPVVREVSYTRAMPVEEIMKRMTLEEACSYQVDFGTCRGWTMKQVAEKRRPSLKWYVMGYTGDDNIVRAAARILLETDETVLLRKAG